ncbi:MAG: hypothetical protein ACR5KX_05055 [Wolbachia sp.]
MRDLPPMYGKANEAVKEIMERGGTKVLSLDEIEEILSSEKTSQKG